MLKNNPKDIEHVIDEMVSRLKVEKDYLAKWKDISI
jgi:hypothetical protein